MRERLAAASGERQADGRQRRKCLADLNPPPLRIAE
jgi:hypothetical protein